MESLRLNDPLLRKAVRQLLDTEYKRATVILLKSRRALKLLAARLSQNLELSAEEVREACVQVSGPKTSRNCRRSTKHEDLGHLRPASRVRSPLRTTG